MEYTDAVLRFCDQVSAIVRSYCFFVFTCRMSRIMKLLLNSQLSISVIVSTLKERRTSRVSRWCKKMDKCIWPLRKRILSRRWVFLLLWESCFSMSFSVLQTLEVTLNWCLLQCLKRNGEPIFKPWNLLSPYVFLFFYSFHRSLPSSLIMTSPACALASMPLAFPTVPSSPAQFLLPFTVPIPYGKRPIPRIRWSRETTPS